MYSKREMGAFAAGGITALLSVIFSECGLHILATLLMLSAALLLYVVFYRHCKSLVALPALLSAFWLGGIGVAMLKLSNLSAQHWTTLTWCSLLGFYLCFIIGYMVVERFWKDRAMSQSVSPGKATKERRQEIRDRLWNVIIGMTIVSIAVFVLEAILLGFIPAFIKDTPHAYSTFHVSGLHYFTVSSVMVHPLSIIYLWWNSGYNLRTTGHDGSILKKYRPEKRTIVLAVLNVCAFMVPVLCVSRYFMIMSIALSLVTFLAIKKLEEPKKLAMILGGCFLVLIPAYVLLTVLRAHDVEYLNGIFDMKNPNTPIFVTQPYMYIANNFENFNCLVEQLPQFAWGKRLLYPAYCLSGMKFVFPGFVPGTLYITKEELTTLTLIYDAFYDFGIVGVLGFGMFLGGFSRVLSCKTKANHNPVAYLIYAQFAMYLVLSFFTTWFSNPTTWFWLVLTGMMYLYVGYRRKKI